MQTCPLGYNLKTCILLVCHIRDEKYADNTLVRDKLFLNTHVGFHLNVSIKDVNVSNHRYMNVSAKVVNVTIHRQMNVSAKDVNVCIQQY